MPRSPRRRPENARRAPCRRLASFGPVLSAKGENRPADGGAFPLACCAMHRYINARVVSGSAFIFSGLGDSPLPNRGGVFQRRCSAPDAQLNLEGMIPEEGRR